MPSVPEAKDPALGSRKVSIVVLTVLNALLTMLAVVLGGTLLYLRGEVLLGEAVRDRGVAEVSAVSRTLNATMQTPAAVTQHFLTQTKLHQHHTAQQFSQFAQPISLASLISHSNLFLAGTAVSGHDYVYEFSWYDLQAERNYIIASSNSSAQCSGEGLCVPCYSVDTTTFVKDKVYDLRSDVDVRVEKEWPATARTTDAHRWSGVSSWVRPGGVVHYAEYGTFLGLRAKKGYLKGRQVSYHVGFAFDEWSAELARQESDAEVVVVEWGGEVSLSLVLAASFALPEVHCEAGEGTVPLHAGRPTQCAPTVGNLSAAMRDAVFHVLEERPGSPMRRSVAGKERFVFGATVFKPQSGDSLNEIVLVWIAPEEADFLQAFIVFFVFVAAAVFFDVVVVVVEAFAVAAPLRDLHTACQYIEIMHLDVALDILSNARRCVAVCEVDLLVGHLQGACEGLLEYRTYLPTSLFPENNSEVSEPQDLASRTMGSDPGTLRIPVVGVSPTNSGGRSSLLAHQTGPNPTGVSLRNVSRGVLMEIKLLNHVVLDSEHFCGLVAVLEEIAFCTRGTFSGFGIFTPNTFVFSYNGVVHCPDPSGRATVAAKKVQSSFEQHLFATSITAGSLRLGNVGSKTLRNFVVTGPIVAESNGMAGFAEHYVNTLHTSVLVCNEVAGLDIQHACTLHAIGVLNVQQRYVMVFQIGEDVSETIEWMYIECLSKQDPLQTGLHAIRTMPNQERDIVEELRATDFSVASPLSNIQSHILSTLKHGYMPCLVRKEIPVKSQAFEAAAKTNDDPVVCLDEEKS